MPVKDLSGVWCSYCFLRAPPGMAARVERTRSDNGTGDITFEERATRSDDTTSTPTGFRDIADVDTVEKLIRRTFIDQR